jgi:hypothetical protein
MAEEKPKPNVGQFPRDVPQPLAIPEGTPDAVRDMWHDLVNILIDAGVELLPKYSPTLAHFCWEVALLRQLRRELAAAGNTLEGLQLLRENEPARILLIRIARWRDAPARCCPGTLSQPTVGQRRGWILSEGRGDQQEK